MVRKTSQSFQLYLLLVGAVGLVAAAVIITTAGPQAPWLNILIFGGLAVVGDLTTTDLPKTSRAALSISSAINFSALIIFGPQLGALVGMVSGVATTYVAYLRLPEVRRSSQVSLPSRMVFNMANSGLSTLAAGVFYIGLGGSVGELLGMGDLPAISVAALIRDIVNAGLVVIATALLRNENPWRIWVTNFRLAMPMNVATMAVGGSALAMAFHLASFAGLAVFFLPVLLTSYAFRVYAAQTKEQMELLESMVAERTRELRQSNDELRRLDERRAEFVSVLNHEMRTPLTSIIGFAELLLSERRGPLTKRQQTYANQIREGGERLLRLVNEVLDLSRIEAGEVTQNVEPVHLDELVHDIWSHLRPLADEKHLTMRLDVPTTLPVFESNRDTLNQVFSNLISNAIKYTPIGGSLAVKADYQDTPKVISVFVQDTGIGIAPEDLPLIFERFYRVGSPEVQQVTGTGLGLAIVKGLVEALGGKIEVESELGQGSCFIIRLPLGED